MTQNKINGFVNIVLTGTYNCIWRFFVHTISWFKAPYSEFLLILSLKASCIVISIFWSIFSRKKLG